MPECNLNTHLLQGAGHVIFEATSTVRDCEHLFIRYSCPSLHIRKTRETIHQRWIPLKNLGRCVQVNVS